MYCVAFMLQGKRDFELMEDDEDFEPTSTARLNDAIRRARLSLRRGGSQGLASELGSRFPFARSQQMGATTKRKRAVWKVVPCALSGPGIMSVPKKGILDRLCKHRMGTLWFTKEDPLQIPTYLTPDELHFMFLCLYPMLSGIPYEFCKATGPGNNVIVPLDIPDTGSRPRRDREFVPFFSPDRVKAAIDRKGRIYVRPLIQIDIGTLVQVPEYLVSC